MAAEQSSPKMRRNTNSMKGKYEIKNENDRTTVVETLKQRLLALNNRLSRYQLRQKQYRQNYEFVNKPNKLYDEIRNNKIQIRRDQNCYFKLQQLEKSRIRQNPELLVEKTN